MPARRFPERPKPPMRRMQKRAMRPPEEMQKPVVKPAVHEPVDLKGRLQLMLVRKENKPEFDKAVEAATVPELERVSYGYNILHCVAAEGRPELVETLLRKGVNPEIRTASGETTLGIAKRCGNKKVIEILEKHISEKRKLGK